MNTPLTASGTAIDCSAYLCLRPGYAAHRYDCGLLIRGPLGAVAALPLTLDEALSPAWAAAKIGPARWAHISDWRPGNS